MSTGTMRGSIVRRFPKRVLSAADKANEVRRNDAFQMLLNATIARSAQRGLKR